MRLQDSLVSLKGVGPAKEKAFHRLGINSLEDLLYYAPRQYEDRNIHTAIADLLLEENFAFEAMVTEAFRSSATSRGVVLTRGKIADHTAVVDVVFFNQQYISGALQYGESYVFYGKLTDFGGKKQLTNPYFEKAGEHKLVGGIMPIYGLTAGIHQIYMGKMLRQIAPLFAEVEETLPAYLLKQERLLSLREALENLHFPEDWDTLVSAKDRLIFEELLCLSLGLFRLRGKRAVENAEAFENLNLNAYYEKLPFTLTSAQKRAAEEIAQDLGKTSPMNRLLQGDVGAGKTAVAAAGCYVAYANGKQSAMMAPTDLLARQHHKTLSALLGDEMCVELLVGGLTAKEKRLIRERLEKGEIDLLVGTHALITEDVLFRDLAFAVVDEQHRFGVRQRALLSAKGKEGAKPHILVMSATPIPRTLALMIYGDLDLSIIGELPPNRKSIETHLVGEHKRKDMYGFMEKLVGEGRQIYVVCPTVEEGETQRKAAESHGKLLQQAFPRLEVGIIHGKLKAKEKESIMSAFVTGAIHILVSTTVIEVGVDVPNATVMVIENADCFGLSQLHQLRGRVGRGDKQSYCFMLTDSKSAQTIERLRILVASGDGFHIAEEDLKLRGCGDFFGARQHGLPMLKFASLTQDVTMLQKAQTVAKEILLRDGDLLEPEHRGLKTRVEALFSQNGETLN